MKEIIDVFNMTELSGEVRARIIIKLGRAINDQYANNITEELVFELVKLLDPNNKILSDKHYLRFVEEPNENHK